MPDKRQRVIKAASQLIVTNGLQCPMSAIATNAGVAIGSVYNYFASKDELVLAVYAELGQQVNVALVREINRGQSHRERLMVYIYDYIDFFWEDPDRAILFEYLSNVPLIPHAALTALFEPVRRYHDTLIAEAQAEGATKPFDPGLMAALIGGGIRNYLKWYRAGHSTLERDHREHIAKMCWDAISA